MQRPATWKVVTVGAAMASLGVLSTGAAMAADTEKPTNICCKLPVAAAGDGDASAEDSRLWYQFPIEANRDGDISPKESSLLSCYVGL